MTEASRSRERTRLRMLGSWIAVAIVLLASGLGFVELMRSSRTSAPSDRSTPPFVSSPSTRAPTSPDTVPPPTTERAERAPASHPPADPDRVLILDVRGNPLADVEAFALTEGAHPRCLVNPDAFACSDREGRMLLPPGDWLLYREDLQPTEIRDPSGTVVLRAGERATVKVTDGRSGAPLADFPLFATSTGRLLRRGEAAGHVSR